MYKTQLHYLLDLFKHVKTQTEMPLLAFLLSPSLFSPYPPFSLVTGGPKTIKSKAKTKKRPKKIDNQNNTTRTPYVRFIPVVHSSVSA